MDANRSKRNTNTRRTRIILHERWDGQGYPDAQAGGQIALSARYFAVIDSFDAMTSLRPYRNATGLKATNHAMDELEAGSGTRYWPHAVEVFSRLYRTGRLDWISQYFNDTCPVEYDHAAKSPADLARRN